MLKGHVFKKQIFGNQIFALFINTFLNGQNGVSNNYKNGMQVTASGSTLTVQNGAVCIQGRFLEEDTSTQISAGTDAMYCKLVIEINLSLDNTENEFKQASYKIVKSSSGYPALTQNDIVKNNEGIYQYELARFRTTANGITDLQDMRTFLDFDSIYSAIQTEYRAKLSELEQELANVEDGSAYILKETREILYENNDVRIELVKVGKLCTIIAYSKKTISSKVHYDFSIPDAYKPKNQDFYCNKQTDIDYASNTGTIIRAFSSLAISKDSTNYFDAYSLDDVHHHFYNSLSYYIDS